MTLVQALHTEHLARRQRLGFRPKVVKLELVVPEASPAPPVIEVNKPEPAGKLVTLIDFSKVIPNPSENKITLIKRCVCLAFNIRRMDMDSVRKMSGLAVPRMAAMALCRHLTPHSTLEIGRRFGGRDHTTVIHAIRKYQPLIAKLSAKLSEDASIPEWVEAMHAEMKRPEVK